MVINVAIFGAFLLIFAILGLFLWQTLFPSNQYSDAEEKTEISRSEQNAGEKDSLRGGPAKHASNSTEKAIAYYTKWLAFFTFCLVVATVGLFISGERNVEVARETAAATRDALRLSEKNAKRQAEEVRAQLTLAHPPQIKVVDVTIQTTGRPYEPPTLKAGEKIEGRVWIVNVGREVAALKKAVLITRWHDGPLPMHKPYPIEKPDPPISRDLVIRDGVEMEATPEQTVMSPGNVGEWSFETQVPANFIGNQRLHVIGYVIYVDRLREPTRRATYFARVYDPSERRFLPVKYSNYESEE